MFPTLGTVSQFAFDQSIDRFSARKRHQSSEDNFNKPAVNTSFQDIGNPLRRLSNKANMPEQEYPPRSSFNPYNGNNDLFAPAKVGNVRIFYRLLRFCLKLFGGYAIKS